MNNKMDQVAGKGVYHNDYSPRYQEAYDIYEKARLHIKSLKKNEGNHVPNGNLKRQKTDTK